MKDLPKYLMCAAAGAFAAALGFRVTSLDGFIVTVFLTLCILEFYRRTEK